MIKKLIFGLVFILLILMELGYMHHRLSTKLQALENSQRQQNVQLYFLETAMEKTVRKVHYLRQPSHHKQQQNTLPGIYLAAN